MDLIVWCWSENKEKVVVNYLDFQFMGNSQAEVFVERMKKSLSSLDPNKLLQISVDDPRVNLKFIRLFEEDRSKQNLNFVKVSKPWEQWSPNNSWAFLMRQEGERMED